MKDRFKNILAFFGSKKTFLFFTYCLSFSFSLTPFISSLTLIIFCFFSLFHLQKPTKAFFVFSDIVLLSFLFLLYTFSLNFTSFPERAIDLTYRITPIFILPILICFTNLPLKVNYSILKKYFILGIIISCFISLFASLYNYIKSDDIKYFFYYKLGEFLHIHPTYFSLFILTAIHFLINQKDFFLKRNRLWITALFVIIIFLLQSKIAIILLVLYFLFTLIFLKKSNIKFIAFLISLVLLIIIVALKLKDNRYHEFFKERESIDIGNQMEDGVSQRLWLWSEAYNQLKEKPLFGYGLGSQHSIFRWNVEKYILENKIPFNYSRAIKSISKLNLHNQYIQTFYELGIVGGLLYVLSIVLIIARAFKRRKYEFLIIFSLYMSFMMTENLLDRQMGIYFYAFIISLLYFDKEEMGYNNK